MTSSDDLGDIKCVVAIPAIGNFPEMEISQDEFDSAVDAREKLLDALSIEERYEIAIRNYEEWE